MKIVFYSTTASAFEEGTFSFFTWPRRADVWSCLHERYPEHEFYIVTQKPACFLLDGEDPVTFLHRERITVLPDTASVEDVVCAIFNTDALLAIACTGWAPPFDWLGVQDALVAEKLSAHGMRVMCHQLQTALDFFDKRRTHEVLSQAGFLLPKAVYVHHELYWCERSHHELIRNVYKEAVLRAIQRLQYPVVIKDTAGLSSYSMEVAVSYKQALSYLNSGRTRCDRIVEEYIAGDQAGVELYVPPALAESGEMCASAEGEKRSLQAAYVFSPLLFSLNRYGITSPKQSVKLGGVEGMKNRARYHIDELESLVKKLSALAHFSGGAQIDLVHSEQADEHGRHWYIIEVNPRLSGMSETYAASVQKSALELLLRTALSLPLTDSKKEADKVLNIKLPLLDAAQLAALCAEPCVRYVHQICNTQAKQEREKGYCELVLCAPTYEVLTASLAAFTARYGSCMESAFVKNAHALFSKLV
mgnify:FL=1